jgi:uncharacterized protein (TIGR01244 family)
VAIANTLRTLVRYWVSTAERAIGKSLLPARIEAISNYLKIDEHIATGGQPNASQIPAIARAGYTTVINLAPYSSSNALPGEAAMMEQAGIEYHHIPVVWTSPTEEDFKRFCTIMEAHKDHRVFVHCAANMRVSAFIYRYRCTVLGVDERLAAADLVKLWTPAGVWADFVSRGHGAT